MYMDVLPVCAFVYHIPAWCWQSPKEVFRSPGTGIIVTIWVLGFRPKSFGRVARALKHQVISPDPKPLFLIDSCLYDFGSTISGNVLFSLGLGGSF